MIYLLTPECHLNKAQYQVLLEMAVYASANSKCQRLCRMLHLVDIRERLGLSEGDISDPAKLVGSAEFIEKLRRLQLSQQCYCDEFESACRDQPVGRVLTVWNKIEAGSDDCAKWAPRRVRDSNIGVTKQFKAAFKAAGLFLEFRVT